MLASKPKKVKMVRRQPKNNNFYFLVLQTPHSHELIKKHCKIELLQWYINLIKNNTKGEIVVITQVKCIILEPEEILINC